jgi:hypothetical protein
VVAAVGRRLVPYVIEATLIPTLLFYTCLAIADLRWAIAAALAWSYGAVLRRLLTGQAIPGLLLLGCLGVTVKTAVFLCNDNTFVYFVQPVLRTLLTAGGLALSVLLGKPLIARFASDFCSLSPEVQARDAIARLFRRLTYLWAGVNLAAATVSFVLLLTLPTAAFVGTATLAAWIITGAGVVCTVIDAVGTARAEGLATAVGPNGSLRAYVL